MTINSWSLFYDAAMEENHFNLNMAESKRYKYNEEEILKELSDYITGTYNQHYSAAVSYTHLTLPTILRV